MKKNSFLNLMDSLVSISSLNQGKASKIIQSLGHDDVKIVVKNNEPMAAIIPVSRYSELVEAEERLSALEGRNHKWEEKFAMIV